MQKHETTIFRCSFNLLKWQTINEDLRNAIDTSENKLIPMIKCKI